MKIGKIDFGIPIPNDVAKMWVVSKYPFCKMKVGSSVVFTPEASETIKGIRGRVTSAIATFNTKAKGRKKFISRAITNIDSKQFVRVWRVK
jgi:hypothetical protein